ncbi:sensor histidine kinase [Paenibacillus antibioticophila]|uniref:histidine kinase n=1 Tax=Paenibacillus antibioticophila TaxID=1274374 RepID=A0A920CFC2_9BACL|nr:sensor histidine kinase [Paenibacillus antibioticophila]GIO37465.1 sensor histidine kinase [Paenibacillus antibioticophila]
MKLFWKEHVPLMLFYSVQVALVPILYWLTGEGRPFAIVLYGVLLSTVVLVLYLMFRYCQHRRLYLRLEEPLAAEEELLQPMDEAPLSNAVHELLRSYDRHFRDQLRQQQSGNEQHLAFMNRWVHQMKTPISVIQLLLQELEEPAADSIQEELDRLSKGLEMVLYTARLGRFEHDFSVQAVELLQIVNQVVAGNRRLFISKGITPRLQIRKDLKVYTDAKWLRFSLDQIVVNALKYTVGTDKQVSISAEEQGDWCELTVQDQGIGIEREDLNRVFHPYYTGEHGRQYQESTGMGLYLVKEVCELLGHEVMLQSEPGSGTRVTLLFKHYT